MHEMPGFFPVELATFCSSVRVDPHHTAQHDTTRHDTTSDFWYAPIHTSWSLTADDKGGVVGI